MPLVTVKNLTKAYEMKKLFGLTKVVSALKGISFDVKQGEIFGILGPNGAGKSTTLNILADLLTHDSGEITILGKDFFKHTTALKEQMALINGYASYPVKLSIFENMKIFAKVYGVENAEERIIELLRVVDLLDKKDTAFSELSSGQRTRVNIVKGFLHKPKLVLMDEPTIGLDPHIAKKIRKLIIDMNRREKTTIIFTSHNMVEVEEVCNRVALLKEGKILKTATIKELTQLIDVHEYHIEYSGKEETLNTVVKKHKGFEIQNKKQEIIFQAKNAFELEPFLKELHKKSIGIQDISIKRPTLEQVFIEVAEGRL